MSALIYLFIFTVKVCMALIILPFWIIVAIVSVANNKRAPRFPVHF
jgi:hypothetical protein